MDRKAIYISGLLGMRGISIRASAVIPHAQHPEVGATGATDTEHSLGTSSAIAYQQFR